MQPFYEIEVFKTSIQSTEEADKIKQRLLVRFPDVKINFDLDDGDRILRIVPGKEPVAVAEIVAMLRSEGFLAEALD